MVFCWHDQLFIFCLLLFYLFLPSMGWLCGVGVFGLIVFSLSLGVAQWTNVNNKNNKGSKSNKTSLNLKAKEVSLGDRWQVCQINRLPGLLDIKMI